MYEVNDEEHDDSCARIFIKNEEHSFCFRISG